MFSDCGGDPVGLWRETAVDTSGFKLSFYERSSGGLSLLGECATSIPAAPTAFQFRVEFLDGGGANVSSGIEMGFQALESCVQRMIPSSSCEKLEITGATCAAGACGICSCQLRNAPAQLTGTWTSSVNTVTFTAEDGTYYVFAYCVQGDTMRVRDRSGIVATLERDVGTGGSGGGTGGSGGGTGGSGGGTGGSGGSAGGCGLAFNIPVCDSCLEQNCCDEASACEGDPSCNAMFTCARACGSDQVCRSACGDQYPAGTAGYNEYILCLNNNCYPECP